VTDPAADRVRPISWAEIQRDAVELARRVAPLGPFEGIYAVARGGLVPAAIVARALDIRLVDTLVIASYEGRVRGEARVLKPGSGTGAGWLVIDDLVDTGQTAEVVRAMLPDAHFAVLYAKPSGRALAQTHVAEFGQDTWLAFPWEAGA
jgi:hypoxanthine phosphoribosyltransferase